MTNNQSTKTQLKYTQTDIEHARIIEKSRSDFPFFLNNIFSKSADVLKGGIWTGGQHPNDTAKWLQDTKRTMRVSAKDHFKSMSFYAHIMWKIFRMYFDDTGREIQYFSYKESMASYHTAKLKTAIDCNPYFANLVDLKSQAESVISYQWADKKTHASKITVTPRGLLEFKRGIHCDDVYVDDPLQDPDNKLVLTKVEKINEIMKTQIMDMFQQEIHVVGTAQTQQDFFFDPELTHRFDVKVQPAIINEEKKQVLWKEWMDWEELMSKKRERGPRVFNQEYMVSPVYSEEAFIMPDKYDARINRNLRNYNFIEWDSLLEKRKEDENYEERDVVGGFDIGKKQHPSHLAIFERDPKTRKWVQIHSKWMDGWDYNDQKDYLEQAVNSFKIYVLYYDNTRGEFEAFEESGDLPAAMEPVNFSHKSKHAWAANLDKAISNNDVEFLPETRQRNQILIMNNDLQAPVTKEGHADSFWSVCLGLIGYEGGMVDITVI